MALVKETPEVAWTTFSFEILNEPLKDAVSNGDLGAVERLLQQRANPNAVVHFQRNKTCEGPVLSFAALDGSVEIINALVRGRADLEKSYTTKVGASRAVLHSRPVNACIAQNRLAALQTLVKLRANVGHQCRMDDHATGSTTVWQAAFHGRFEILKFLLTLDDARQHLNTFVTNQDDQNLSHTPVHIAVRQRKYDVVRLLIEEKANFREKNRDENHFSTVAPLVDAIRYCHADLVKLLVSKSADLFLDDAMGALWGQKNVVVISAAAQGLRTANPQALLPMEARHFCKFLKIPGDASMHIIRATFQTKEIRYWEVQREGWSRDITVNRRRVVKTGHLANGSINAAVGPSWRTLNDFFEKKQQMPSRHLEFINRLAPTPRKRHGKLAWLGESCETEVPIEVRHCVLPGVHRNLKVLFAIADSSTKRVFDAPGTQAIVAIGWDEAQWYFVVSFLGNLLMTLLFLVVAVLLKNEKESGIPSSIGVRCTLLVIIILLFIQALAAEVLQFVGLLTLGEGNAYISLGNLLDLCRIVMTSMSIFLLSHRWGMRDQPVELGEATRFLLAGCVLFRWIRALNCLSCFRPVGPRMLPILQAMTEILPFTVVVTFLLAGFMHAYFILGIHSLDRSVVHIYRLAFLGDFDLEEMEDVDGTYNPEEDGTMTWEDPEPTSMYGAVRVLMVVCGYCMTITMMNIMIGVLGESYSAAYQARERVFIHTRACMLRDYRAMDTARKALFGARSKVNPEPDDFEFIWYCVKSGEDDAAEGESEPQQRLPESEHGELRDEVHEMKAQVSGELKSMKEQLQSLDHFIRNSVARHRRHRPQAALQAADPDLVERGEE